MSRVRYKQNDVYKNSFYQVPKFLFEGECIDLSNDVRILYALLRDRHDLSLSNEWINENKEVYLIFSRKNMSNIMGVAEKTAKRAIEQLKLLGLLEEERMGLSKPNRLYLTSVDIENSRHVKFTVQEPQKIPFKNRKNYVSRTEDFTGQEPHILRPNHTDSNQTNYNYTEIQSIHLSEGSSEISDNKDLREIRADIKVHRGIPYHYKGEKDKMTKAIRIVTNWYRLSECGYFDKSLQDIYMLSVECLISMACSSDIERYKGDVVTAEMVIDQINLSIDWHGENITIIEFIDFFIDEFKTIYNYKEIKALVPYMKSCIWNALLTYKAKLSLQVPSA